MKKTIKKQKKAKKVKLIALPKLRKKILKLWAEAVREKENNTCIYCGVKKGDISKVNPSNTVLIDSHHLLQKYIKDCPLKFEIRNGVGLCKSCHKFNGNHSAHKSPIVFYDWLRLNHPDRYNYVLNNSSIRIDLDNRLILEEIEKRLIAKESLDLERLKQIEKDFPREQNPKKLPPLAPDITPDTLGL
jgi:hypothetical protein